MRVSRDFREEFDDVTSRIASSVLVRSVICWHEHDTSLTMSTWPPLLTHQLPHRQHFPSSGYHSINKDGLVDIVDDVACLRQQMTQWTDADKAIPIATTSNSFRESPWYPPREIKLKLGDRNDTNWSLMLDMKNDYSILPTQDIYLDK